MATTDALQALANLSSRRLRTPDIVDPITEAEANHAMLQDEISKNLAKRERYPGGGFATGATEADAAGQTPEGFDVGDPWTGTAARQAAAEKQKQYEADVRYGSPEAAQQRADVLAEKLAPVKEKAAGDLAVEQEKTRSAETLQNDAFAVAMGLTGMPGGGQGTGTQQFTMNIGPGGKPTLQQVKVPQQVQAQQHAAQAGLSEIPQTRQMIDTLNQRGIIGPFTSRAASFGVSTGTDPLLEMLHVIPSGSGSAFNDFKTQLSLIKSNLAYAHGAARGGSSPAMQQRFDQLLNPNQSPEALQGGLTAAERWLTAYANAKSSDELDRADAELGVTPGAQYQRPGGM